MTSFTITCQKSTQRMNVPIGSLVSIPGYQIVIHTWRMFYVSLETVFSPSLNRSELMLNGWPHYQ